MKYEPLKREDIIKVIEGKGNAERIPLLYHFWINPGAFKGMKRLKVERMLRKYPMDVQVISLNMPDAYNAPRDDKSYRWNYRDMEQSGGAIDNAGFLKDWEEELPEILADFPNPDYHGLVKDNTKDDGRYRLGTWFYFFFERFWNIRNMEDALTDFYLYPDEVHKLFDALADFYIRAITNAHEKLHLDAIFTSDDIATQASTFFSCEIFDEFFMPYYKRVIDHVHSLGMHFWLHTCGNVEAFIPKFIELGIDVLHPIQKYTMDEKKIADKFGDKITIWAGFDVQKTIPFGTPEDVRKEVRFMIDTYSRNDGRFMLTLGNVTTSDTPVESLEALFEESLNYKGR